MNAILLRDLTENRAKIKDAWVRGLEGERRLQLLAPRVDQALDELLTACEQQSHLNEPTDAAADGKGPCPENPIVRFYLAGERALLHAALERERFDPCLSANVAGVELTELYLILRRTARKQISRLCGGCATCRKLGRHAHAHASTKHPESIDEEELIGPSVNAIEPA